MRKYKLNRIRLNINIKEVMVWGILASMVGGFFTLLGSIIDDNVDWDNVQEFSNKTSFYTDDGLTYELSGPNSVAFNEGHISYDFDFRNSLIAVNSENEDDGIFKFDEFPNPATIKQTRLNGCAAASKIRKAFADADNADLIEDYSGYLDPMKSAADEFTTNYCASMPAQEAKP